MLVLPSESTPWVVVIVAAAAAAVAGALAAPSPRRTSNILFFLADDLGYGDVSPMPGGSNRTRPRLLTPNMAKLASEGLAFTQAYAGSSVCAPSRYALMTGTHTGHFGHRKGQRTGANGASALTADSVTVAHFLREAGYSTALVGKWGLDLNPKQPVPPSVGFPTKQGFDYFYGQSNQWECHNYFPAWIFVNNTNTSIAKNLHASATSCGAQHEKCVWSADLFTSAATDWIAQQRAKSWFLYLSYTSPHAGAVGSIGENDIPSPRVSSGPYASKLGHWPPVEVHFANCVYLVDAALGVVMSSLDKLGLTENTYLFVSSDNGAHQEGGHNFEFFTSSGPLNGNKRSIHDGGHRAALLVRGPRVPRGAVTEQQWAFYDFFRTAAAIAGIADSSLPPNIDGYSILPTLQGLKQPQPPFTYHEFGGAWGGLSDPMCCISPAGKCVAPKDSELHCNFGINVRYVDADGRDWSGVCVGPTEAADTCDQPGGHFFLYDMHTDQGKSTRTAVTREMCRAA
jgi:arylsulfatase A-like enzyme